jgi:hypothetical protein
MISIILTFEKVRLDDVPLPVPSEDAARALEMCTSSGLGSRQRAPALDGMRPIRNINTLRSNSSFGDFYHDIDATDDETYDVTDDVTDGTFSSLVCESRFVRELVSMCIMANVSSIDSVLLISVPKPTPPLHLFPYIQVAPLLKLPVYVIFCRCVL